MYMDVMCICELMCEHVERCYYRCINREHKCLAIEYKEKLSPYLCAYT